MLENRPQKPHMVDAIRTSCPAPQTFNGPVPDTIRAMAQLSDGDIAFWSVVAQVMPVLALALVLEARLLAERLSKKRARSLRKYRFLWAVWLFATWALIFAVEIFTLIRLATDSPTKDDSDSKWFALLAIVNGFVMVAYMPISRVFNAATTFRGQVDPFAYYWLRGTRLIRRLRRDLDSFPDEHARLRDTRREILMLACNSQVLLSKNDRGIQRAEKWLRTPEDRAPHDVAEIRTYLSKALRYREKLSESYLKLGAELVTADRYIRKTQKIERRMRKQLKLLEDLRATSAKNSDQYVRKILAAASAK